MVKFSKKKDRLSVKKDETEDNDENNDNEPISIVAKQEKEKLTKKSTKC